MARGDKSSFFQLSETQSLLRLFRALASPYSPVVLSELLLDGAFGVPFLTAHKFLRLYGRKLSLESLEKGEDTIKSLGKLFRGLQRKFRREVCMNLFSILVRNSSLRKRGNHQTLLTEIEVVRTFLHLALSSIEKNRKLTLDDFLFFLGRLESYGEDMPLAVFESDEGINVSTLHGSKGLEFEYVWIAHLDQGSLMGGKHMGFTLPESIKGMMAKKDELTAKRELYVAITRAKDHSTLSYPRLGYSGSELRLADIVAEIPDGLFEREECTGNGESD